MIPDVLVPSDAALDTALVLARAAAAEYGAAREERLKCIGRFDAESTRGC